MDWLGLYLEEDLGGIGDITSRSIFSTQTGVATLVAREAGFACGLDVASLLYGRLGCESEVHVDDAWVEAGATLATIRGPTAAILEGERLALNLVGRMSGIATQTRRIVEELAGACGGCTVAATRKTTPGFRVFEKLAVQRAGGDPHRSGLYDVAMVKDNHREACGSIDEAIARVRASHPTVTLVAEVESLEDALAAAGAGAQWLLIDNQPSDSGKAWAEQVWQAYPDVRIEASGGILPAEVVHYGWADRVSLGALTQNVRNMDLSLEWSHNT